MVWTRSSRPAAARSSLSSSQNASSRWRASSSRPSTSSRWSSASARAKLTSPGSGSSPGSSSLRPQLCREAQRARRTRWRWPIRQRGPRSSRARATLAPGSATTRRVETRSTISGSPAGRTGRPPRRGRLAARAPPAGAEEPLGPDEDGHVPPLRPGAVGQAGLVGLHDLVGDERGLGELVGEQGRPDLAVGSAGPGDQRRPAALLGDPVDHRVGQGQDPGPRPEVGRQRQRPPRRRLKPARRGRGRALGG